MTIRRPSAPKLPVTPDVLKKALAELRKSQDHPPISLAVLIMFLGFLRQSSVAPATTSAFDPTRQLTWADIHMSAAGLAVAIKWSKTIQRAADMKTVLLPSTQDPALCPVRAFRLYAATRPHQLSKAPLLTFADGNAITSRYIAKRWGQAVKAPGLSITAFSLHSLRKGGASYSYNHGGSDLNDVMAQGTWKSAAVRTYIKPQDAAPNTVYRALAAL